MSYRCLPKASVVWKRRVLLRGQKIGLIKDMFIHLIFLRILKRIFQHGLLADQKVAPEHLSVVPKPLLVVPEHRLPVRHSLPLLKGALHKGQLHLLIADCQKTK
jgi:hypothetical protein